MEVIKRANLPYPLPGQSTLRRTKDSPPPIRLSLYIPAYRADPERRWRTSRLLLKKARLSLAQTQAKPELERHLARLEQRLRDDRLLIEHPTALGFALFMGQDHIEVQGLLTPCAPLVVVGAFFHVLPLLRSFSSEPHYRLIALDKNKGTIARRDHSGFKPELHVTFPVHKNRSPQLLHPRETSQDLNRIWHNMAALCQTLDRLQKLDPRPLGIIGEDRLRRLFIDDIRPSLTRPVFFQEPLLPHHHPPALTDVVARADQAFRLRVATRAPWDSARLLDSATREGRAIKGWPQVLEAAEKGLIECLFIADEGNCPCDAMHNEGRMFQTRPNPTDAPNERHMDGLVTHVLRHDGSVLFAKSNKESRLLQDGLGAITRTKPSAHLTH